MAEGTLPTAEVPEAGSPADSVLMRIRAALPDLPAALQRVGEQVLSAPAVVARATILETAERSGTSAATVTRFCRALGLPGYADLRLAMAEETGRSSAVAGWEVDIGREILPTDSLQEMLDLITTADLRAIQETAAQLDLTEVEKAADAIADAGRVEVYGIGGSALVAGEMQLCLHRIGIPTWSWSDVHVGLTSAALLGPSDVAIAVSHSGATYETVEMLSAAGSRGATTVALTSYRNSALAEVADIVLTTAIHETTFRPDALAARHPQLIVLDLIYVAVAQRRYETTGVALNLTAQAVSAHRAVSPETARALKKEQR
ncbi:DNA-binding transcriptional regulator, MurR/RpiR family, contains HTH and SIS domains [Jiangella sp. DSM 45060]|uniref:DNA-binding transcriptional regulator, MurR/RpiR family, contains HTH and SIS domains n=2 Tax=Jiangellaceae TaxID=1217100 RepID=A0A1H5M3J3_9ACTN|nr:MurR/RpiR family transcriptional regulator [Jiangella alba]SDT01823.1 DNA-binding transcriptional regulator, MurR/RpiR family, contains HTH and SIS domains [Jiangella sp. DSM 45060]SEE83876.1 DNA-binding transcriptional regulator, MurR/RpiR family, contains HTH and SIS domains [Jiangella alba]